MTDWLQTLKGVEAQLPGREAPFRVHYALRHGTMRVGLYAPLETDTQGPHKQDELYLIASGTGSFIKNGERKAFGPNDVIFVEAGADHRFVDFDPGFAAWVIFWGPDGGETPALP